MLTSFLATYGAVFIAEIVGDKLLYTTGILASRYRAVPIFCGTALAFMAKMAAAVVLGTALSKLPPLLVAAITAVNFIAIAWVLWRRSDTYDLPHSTPTSRAVMVSFAAIFFSEWADVGQITAATMAARFGEPWQVWSGAVCAMVTKSALAASIGAGLREQIHRRLSPKAIRYAAVSLLLFLGALTALETLGEEREIPVASDDPLPQGNSRDPSAASFR